MSPQSLYPLHTPYSPPTTSTLTPPSPQSPTPAQIITHHHIHPPFFPATLRALESHSSSPPLPPRVAHPSFMLYIPLRVPLTPHLCISPHPSESYTRRGNNMMESPPPMPSQLSGTAFLAGLLLSLLGLGGFVLYAVRRYKKYVLLAHLPDMLVAN